jgi:cell division protein FtsW (lipid II flippase)
LKKGFNEAVLSDILKRGGYFDNDTDINYITGEIKRGVEKNKWGLENLGSLNKKNFYVSASEAHTAGGKFFRERYQTSLDLLQYDSAVIEKSYLSTARSSHINAGFDGNTISVKIKDSSGHKVVPGVLVKLEQHFEENDVRNIESTKYDTVYFPDGGLQVSLDTGNIAKKYTIEYVRFSFSDENGEARFSSLKRGGSYSVIPVKKGFEYGSSKGTISLEQDIAFGFKQNEHRLKLFDTVTYSRLKNDRVLTVRLPSGFLTGFLLCCAAFLLSFWLLHIYLSVTHRTHDQFILPLLMMLAGLGVLVNFALPNPLTDVIYGNKMAIGSIAGVVLFGLLSHVNFAAFHSSKWFDFRGFLKLKYYNQPGYLYLAMAAILMIALLAFGTGPEGSGVKVNLFFFQPGELVKYFVVIFFAAYFTRNQDYFMKLPSPGERIRKAIPVIAGLLFLMVFYLVLGDMGPALVLCGMYIIFYSVARGDFKQFAIGAGSYILLIILAGNISDINQVTIIAGVTALWLLVWLAYGWIMKKTFYPSAVYLVLIIAAFNLGENIPHVGERLKERNQMFANVWDNQTYGGDQVAHGIWSITTGGFWGQGIGEGNSTVMPANNTDMILASIGEELGFTGLVVVFLCMGLLLYRSLLSAKRSAQPFCFYLAGGIAVVTAIQFFVITAGCFGLIPLTGISVPFLSYGMVSIIINLAAFGIVSSVSILSGDRRQKEYMKKTYNDTIVFGSLAYSLVSIIILGLLFYYQVLVPDKFIIKPAIVVNKDGERIVSENPRINILVQQLAAGNIYDRNGLLLATSDKNKLLAARDSTLMAGVEQNVFDVQANLQQKRYYPFGAHLFFWTGDFNSRLLWGNTAAGYFAENRHLSLLRGFDNSPKNGNQDENYFSSIYKPDPFLPKRTGSFSLPLYDYSALIPLLKAGMNSKKVSEFNTINKDITLTVDAQLQTALQNAIVDYLKESKKAWRTSVVVLNPQNGDVLCSAVYPLPDNSSLKALEEIKPVINQIKKVNRISLDSGKSIFTERDLGLTFPTQPGSTAKVMSGLAGLNKLGAGGANVKYYVDRDEVIREKDEPSGDSINMEGAIVRSSNVYFIKLINEHRLDTYLENIYLAAGIDIVGRGNYSFIFNSNKGATQRTKKLWQDSVFNHQSRKTYSIVPRTRNTLRQSRFSGLAWGQGEMKATPLVMARVTGAVANKGILKNSKFLLKSSTTYTLMDTSFAISDSVNAGIMGKFMRQQATVNSQDKLINLSSKTGTPQRAVPGNEKNFDGWFMFYAYSPKIKGQLAVCIRMERAGSSGEAVRLANGKIIQKLIDFGYLENK